MESTNRSATRAAVRRGAAAASQGMLTWWATRLRAVALPGTLAATAIVLRLLVGPLTIDDAYITFRYARNLAGGLGFTYNPGQHVIGTTTPLYTMILAVAYRAGFHDLPHLSLAMAALADGMTTVLVYAAARRFGFDRFWASIPALLFALCSLSITYAAGGMESSFFTWLIVAALSADMADRPVLSGILAGLAVLTRPEGALVAMLIVGRRVVTQRRIPWRVIIPVAALYIPWLLYAYWWTGSVLSESVMAKASAYSDSWLQMLTALLQAFSAPGLDSGYNVILYSVRILQIELVVVFFILVGSLFVLALSPRVIRALRRWPSWWAFIAFAPLLVGAYALAGTRGVRLFPWYVVPLTPFYMLGIAATLRFLARHVSRHLATLAVAAFIAWTVYGLALSTRNGHVFVTPRGFTLAREDAYREAADALASYLRPHAVVALQEIGTFGYFSGAPILDVGGLVSPAARRFYPLPKRDAIPAGLIREQRPEWVVSFDVFVRGPLENAPWFRREYHLVEQIPASYIPWRTKAVLIYRRRT